MDNTCTDCNELIRYCKCGLFCGHRNNTNGRAMATAKRITPTMVAVLRMACDGISLYGFCMNRADHGSRTGSIMALRKRGLLMVNEITDEGRAALAAELKRGF